jgi:DNA-binding transcriptional LysR family regulator
MAWDLSPFPISGRASCVPCSQLPTTAADLGITFVDELPDTIAMVPLGREVFHAVMPRQHRLAPLRGITMTQIARESLVSLPNGSWTRRAIDAAASKQGITLRHAVAVTQFETMMSRVRAGLGVADCSRVCHRGRRHLEAHPLGLVDRSGLMRIKE